MSVQENEPLIKSANTETKSALKDRSFVRYVLFPLFVFFLFTFAYGMGYYAITQWVQHFVSMELFPNATVNSSAKDGCKDTNHSDPNYITFQKVESQTALWQMYYMLALTVPAFVVSTLLPSYSDTYGRRFLFITGVSGVFVKACIFAASVYFKLSLFFIVACSAIEGVTGSFYAVNAAAYGYVADITTVGRQRTIGITIYDGIMMLTTTLSGPATGLFIQKTGFFITVAVHAILTAISLLLLIFFVPETHEKKFRSNVVSVYSNFRRTVDFYSSSAFKGRRCAYLLLLIAFLFEELTVSHRSSIEMLYQLGQPFCWNSVKVGYFSSARHAAQGFLGMLFVGPMKRCFSELQIAVLGTISNTGSYVLEAFARTDLTMYLVAVISTWSYLTVPMVKSIMSSMTSADKQGNIDGLMPEGSLFASVEAMHSVSGVISSFMFNPIYAATVHIMNGFVFLVLAAVCVVVFFILVLFSCTQTVYKYPDAIQNKRTDIEAEE